MGSKANDHERTDLRYEIKMVCQESAFARVLASMRLHASGISDLYEPRRVQSIYLDTLDGRALEDNLAGISHREKLRFRWYGESTDIQKGTLERKVRQNLMGWKDLAVIDEPVELAGLDRRAFLRYLERGVPAEWRHELRSGFAPVQWISYKRNYYSTADKRVRITMDRDLRAWDQRALWRLSQAQPSRMDRILVVEAKCAEADYDYARDVLRGLPLFVDRCSKFVMASTADDGPHPSVFPE